MTRRLPALLLTLVTVLGLLLAAPRPAAADDDDGFIANGVETICLVGINKFFGPSGMARHGHLCDVVGDATEGKAEEAAAEKWEEIKGSLLGELIVAATDLAKWTVKMILTLGLQGPSIDLEASGLFGRDATLHGMLVWLGLVFSTFGMMWQTGKMALTGQARHLGRAVLGWVENMLLSSAGVGIFAVLLTIGDAMTKGLIDATFENDATAYEQIAVLMVPAVANPVTALCVVAVLLLIGLVQMLMIFLRQAVIPVICLLLPIAGGGRSGGDTTRQWAPRLITAGLVVVAYKPMLAVIFCIGFSNFGQAGTVGQWLLGCATLVLAILAPGALTKVFAPFGAAVGGGMAGAGAMGALQAGAGYLARRRGGGGSGTQDGSSGVGAGDDGDTDGRGDSASPGSEAVSRSQYLAQVMGQQADGRGSAGAVTQATPGGAGAALPRQGTAGGHGQDGAGGPGGADGSGGVAVAGPGPTGGRTAPASSTTTLQVLDGVNDLSHDAGTRIGEGNEPA